MSGIAGILNLDGSPVDRSLIEELTHSQAFQGPDAQQVWLGGNVAFGHTLLKTTEEAAREHQPLSLGGDIWIVADCRIDARLELIAKLLEHGQNVPADSPDVEIVMRAYQVWGADCLDHLLGDFAFGIWDGPRQRLFCARDHMGVKPFYYALVGSHFIFGSTIKCIRQHLAVSNRLNEQAVADFLLVESNTDPATTIFSDIQRLTPAHRAIWTQSNGLTISRYWTMPIDEPVFYRRADDYTDRFRELLRDAVGDRLRTNRAGVFMSGGLDSTTLAAASCEFLKARYGKFDLRAFTDVDDFKPEERDYATSVATHLGIPIQFHKWDETPVDSSWERTPFQTPEPFPNAWQFLAEENYWAKIASHGRAFFWGEGPDSALRLEWRPYMQYLSRKGLYGRMLSDACSTIFSQRRLPFWVRMTRKLHKSEDPPELELTFPEWINPNFEARLHLRERWGNVVPQETSLHPVHPQGYAALQSPIWPVLFEGFAPESLNVCIEMRHPFVDLRMLRFLLSVPALPWCRSKYLMRRAMRGALPAKVLRRVKSGPSSSKIMNWIGRPGLVPFSPVEEVRLYVDPKHVPDIPNRDVRTFREHLRIRSLNHWLQYSVNKRHTSPVEAC